MLWNRGSDHTPDPKEFNVYRNFMALAADGPCVFGDESDGCECITCQARAFVGSPTIEDRSQLVAYVHALYGASVVDLTRRLQDITVHYQGLYDECEQLRLDYETTAADRDNQKVAAEFYRARAEQCERRQAQEMEMRAFFVEADECRGNPIVQLVAAAAGGPLTIRELTEQLIDPTLAPADRTREMKGATARMKPRVTALTRVTDPRTELVNGRDWLTEQATERGKGYSLSDRARLMLHATEPEQPIEWRPTREQPAIVIEPGRIELASGLVAGGLPALPAAAG